MFKLTRAVGENCPKATKADIEKVQIALSNITNKRAKPYFSGQIDGKPSKELEAAITAFQIDQKIPVTGKIDTVGTCISRIRAKVPARLFMAAGQVRSGAGMSVATTALRSVSGQEVLLRKHLTAKKVGWVNDLEGAFAPGKAVLVQAKTGKLVVDADGNIITGPKLKISSPPLTHDDAIAFLRPTEGYTDYMYLDTVGRVTIAVGYNIEANGGLLEAKRLPFMRRSDKRRATAQEIEAEYARIKALPSGQQYAAGFYLKHAKLFLSESDINSLMQKAIQPRINRTVQKLLNPQDSELPLIAKLTAFDILYNVGLDGAKKFKCALSSLRRRDWANAAIEQRGKRPKGRADHVEAEVKKLITSHDYFISLLAKPLKKQAACSKSSKSKHTVKLLDI